MLVREFISNVRNELNNVVLDTTLSDRYIFNKGIYYSDLLIKREADSRRIWQNTKYFKTIDCFKLEVATPEQCVNIRIPNCKVYSKSIEKMPPFYGSIYGDMIQVLSIDESEKFIQTTPENYKNILNREFQAKTNYYWFKNDYLIIPGYIKAVNIKGLFKTFTTDSCKGILWSELGMPDWVITDIMSLVVKDIANYNLRIVKDNDPNKNVNDKA